MANSTDHFQFRPSDVGIDYVRPAGTRETFTLSMGGTTLDKIPGTWQEDGTVILDRRPVVSGPALFSALFGRPARSMPIEHVKAYEPEAPQPAQQDDWQEQVRKEKEREKKRYGKEVAHSLHWALDRARAGEIAVPCYYYKYVNRVVVRKDALEADFDALYDYVVRCIGPQPYIKRDEGDCLIYARKK